MQQPRKRAARSATRIQPRAKQRGGTFLGLVLGLIVGLAIAVVVALYITNSPTPFHRKGAQKAGDAGNVAENLPNPAQEAPGDPNKPLWSKSPAKPVGQPDADQTASAPATRPARPASPAAPAATPDAQAPSVAVITPQKPADKPVDAPRPTTKPAERPVADPIAEIAQADASKVGYLLQVGAFRSQDDADRQKANLAMQGFESKVTDRDVNGVKLYRVRLGPYAKIEDMNRARDRLQGAGFDASVIRFTKQ